ncbi:5-methyltetrahydrofolate--homocysteine methyltransferase, partial [hydrothermal vent metagenome]
MNAREQLTALAAERILVFDGGYGTAIQNHGLGERDYRGTLELTDDQKGNNDLLSLTRPDIIEAIHTAYLNAGADIVETNTFSSTQISQGDYGCQHLVWDLNVKSAEIARTACNKAEAQDGKKRF